MLRFKDKNSDKGAYVELPHNLSLLMELNHGPIWVKLLDGRDALLYGADLNAWMGDGAENIYFMIDGEQVALPSSVQIIGYYERERKQVVNAKGDNVKVGKKTGDAVKTSYVYRPDVKSINDLLER